VLIIELKKGKSAIGQEEMNQADGYVQDFLGSGALDGTLMFWAFVVGHEIAANYARERAQRRGRFARSGSGCHLRPDHPIGAPAAVSSERAHPGSLQRRPGRRSVSEGDADGFLASPVLLTPAAH